VEEHVIPGAVMARGGSSLQSAASWRAIEEEFLASGDASRVERALTEARDALALEAYRAAIEPSLPQGVAMLASGAYGRGDTFPYSELDVLLLLDSARQAGDANALVPDFARRLWNAGLRVNFAVRTVDECIASVEAAADATLGLLARRFLAGDRAVFEKLESRLAPALESSRQKMAARLSEIAQARHTRFQNTPNHAEPDVKDAPGGLEDLRLWEQLALLNPDRAERTPELEHAAAAVARARCFLHYQTGGDHNVLTFEAQEALAKQGFARAVYFPSARLIFREACRAMEAAEKNRTSLLENFREYRSRLSNEDFTVSRGRLFLRNPAQLATDPLLIFRMLEFISRHGVPASAETERRLETARDAFAAWCALQKPIWPVLRPVLACPYAGMALRTLEITGLMEPLFPEWSAAEFNALPEAAHLYTAGEFAFRTIEELLQLRSNASADRQRFAQLLSEADDVAPLLLALLFQALPPGEGLARLQMPDDTNRTVEFLIRHQGDMAEATAGRDMDDPATAHLLAERAGTIEHLKLLTLSTYAKIAAGRADAKLSWRLEQLWRAYGVAQHELIRSLETERIEQVPETLPANAAFIKGFPLRYLRAHSEAEIQTHLQLFERSRPTGVAVRLEPLETAYLLTVVARDKPFLFASFAGAIATFGLDILKAEAFANSTGTILDTFVFADPKRMLQQNPSEADRLTDLIQRIATGKTDVRRLMRGRVLPENRKRTAAPQVQFDSEACPTATLVEIATDDRPGLLYSLATVFSSSACNIDVVLVDTKGHRAIDVFYVAQEGRKLSPEVQAVLKERLLAAC
jgi:[protein-PII] uridylyltransferase